MMPTIPDDRPAVSADRRADRPHAAVRPLELRVPHDLEPAAHRDQPAPPAVARPGRDERPGPGHPAPRVQHAVRFEQPEPDRVHLRRLGPGPEHGRRMHRYRLSPWSTRRGRPGSARWQVQVSPGSSPVRCRPSGRILNGRDRSAGGRCAPGRQKSSRGPARPCRGNESRQPRSGAAGSRDDLRVPDGRGFPGAVEAQEDGHAAGRSTDRGSRHALSASAAAPGPGLFRSIGDLPGVAWTDYAFTFYCDTATQLFPFRRPRSSPRCWNRSRTWASAIQAADPYRRRVPDPRKAPDGRHVRITVRPQNAMTMVAAVITRHRRLPALARPAPPRGAQFRLGDAGLHAVDTTVPAPDQSSQPDPPAMLASSSCGLEGRRAPPRYQPEGSGRANEEQRCPARSCRRS